MIVAKECPDLTCLVVMIDMRPLVGFVTFPASLAINQVEPAMATLLLFYTKVVMTCVLTIRVVRFLVNAHYAPWLSAVNIERGRMKHAIRQRGRAAVRAFLGISLARKVPGLPVILLTLSTLCHQTTRVSLVPIKLLWGLNDTTDRAFLWFHGRGVVQCGKPYLVLPFPIQFRTLFAIRIQAVRRRYIRVEVICRFYFIALSTALGLSTSGIRIEFGCSPPNSRLRLPTCLAGLHRLAGCLVPVKPFFNVFQLVTTVA